MKRKGVSTSSIETILQQQIGLNSRYIKDAFLLHQEFALQYYFWWVEEPAIARARYNHQR
jgi:hypothetical protein